MALALYRRYRPDTFDGVIGQDQVTVPLMRALDQGKLTHAYLFSGPRGCGKTSSARILARCVNCAKGPTSHPCGECESCKDLATGGPGSIDVVEIDAASHNGVDDARELRERAGFAPARDRYKIFILDEAHMVTQQGFNALLKIVEEPPEHVMFIFATTEPEKVIGTIRSRTHHYPFRLVPQEVMGPYLERICEQERISPEPGVLKLAMRAGGGSMRDTLSVLDQLMVGAVDGVIPYDSAVALLGFTPEALIGEAVDAVIDKNGEALYGVVQKVVVGGFDPRRFVEDLLARVRDLLVLTLGGERAEHVLGDDAAEDMDGLRRQASALTLPELTAMAETINTALGSMSGATSPRMRLELLAARLLAGREHGVAPVSGTQPSEASGFQGRESPQPAPRVGFAGAARNRKPQEPLKRNAPGGAARDGVANGEPRPNGDAASPQPASTGGRPRSGADEQADTQRASAPSQAPDNRTPDQKWDAVLAALPGEIREYVDRSKVPTISYAVDGSGKGRLSMTFDTALSQHAFSLAVATDAEHSGRKAANVVLEEVRRAFGAHTMIAPTGVAANGEHVLPIKRLSPEQLAQVKTQIAMAKAGLAAANLSHMTAGRATTESGKTASDNGAEASENDEAGHRGAAAASTAAPTAPPPDDDPWAQPMPARSDAAAAPPAAPAGRAMDDDPWVPSHPRKHVEVPDLTDDDDPWAKPLPAPQPAAATPARQPAERQPSPETTRYHFFAGAGARESDDPWGSPSPSSGGGFGMHGGQSAPSADVVGDPSGPQVDPDDDEYSLNDESLGAATALSVDELSKMFEVKKIEEFAADDPKNPKNIQPSKHGMG